MNGQGGSSASATSLLPWSLSGSARGSAGLARQATSKAGCARRAFDRSSELPDGYTFRLVDRADELAALMEVLVREGISHRLSRVAITVDEEEARLWVRISGSPEVKAFLRARILCGTPSGSQGDE